jgi:hypothetical protein
MKSLMMFIFAGSLSLQVQAAPTNMPVKLYTKNDTPAPVLRKAKVEYAVVKTTFVKNPDNTIDGNDSIECKGQVDVNVYGDGMIDLSPPLFSCDSTYQNNPVKIYVSAAMRFGMIDSINGPAKLKKAAFSYGYVDNGTNQPKMIDLAVAVSDPNFHELMIMPRTANDFICNNGTCSRQWNEMFSINANFID